VTFAIGPTTATTQPKPTREAAFAQLDAFLPRAAHYTAERNFDLPDHHGVSRLSAQLKHRLILEEEVIRTVLDRYAPSTVKQFVEEVCWRTYWKGWLEMRPAVWTDYMQQRTHIAERRQEDGMLSERLDQAETGQTGLEAFDHWVEELRTTGYLHNHARMWFASIWIFTLRLPWQAGAAFFMRHLLDSDPASNTLSWRWVAGLHTRGKHYVALAYNIARYTEGRFQMQGQLNEDPVPLTEEATYPGMALAARSDGAEACVPSLNESPSGLLHTAEDLSCEVGAFREAPFTSEALFTAQDIDDAMDYAEPVRRFTRQAMDDAAERAAVNWDGRVIALENPTTLRIRNPGGLLPEYKATSARIYRTHVPHWVQGVVAWAKRENLRAVRCYEPPVGPWRDRMPTLKAALEAANVSLYQYRRPWDSRHWPHAKAGYFRFKKGLWERLAEGV